jgi:hypothetical protein
VQLRFEVEVVDGVDVFVQELRHAPQGMSELQKRRERAEEALARVKKEMEEARLAPTYEVATYGTLNELRERNSR